MSVAIGKPKTGGNRKTFKLEKGDNVFRILPPMKSLAEAGKWHVYCPVQWGFKNTNGQMRPFIDPRKVNFNTRMVEVESAAYLLRERLKAAKEVVVAEFKAGNTTKEEVTKAVEAVRQFNLEGKHYVNAVNLKGEIGLLKLNTKFKNTLEAQIKEYQEKNNQHPLYMGEDGMTGLFFTFHRSNATNKLQDWVFQVSPYLENRADGAMAYKNHTMDVNFIDRLESEAFDLGDLYPTPSAEEVERMVNEGAVAVDEVFGVREETTKAPAPVSEPVAAQPTVTPVTPVTPVPTLASVVPVTSEAFDQGDLYPTLSAKEAERMVNEGNLALTATVDTATADAPPQTTTASGSKPEMSDNEFLKSIGAETQ